MAFCCVLSLHARNADGRRAPLPERLPMDIEYYKLRLNAVDSAATQGRWVSILSTVASIAILGGIWNSLPWGHYAHVQRYWQEGYALDTATADLQKELLKTWVNSLFLRALPGSFDS